MKLGHDSQLPKKVGYLSYNLSDNSKKGAILNQHKHTFYAKNKQKIN